MMGEFVERRGGGLLMLGGPRAFGEGATPDARRRRAAGDDRAGRACARHGAGRPAAREADARGRGARGHADRRDRSGLDRPLGRHAGVDERQHGPRGEAGRDGAAQRHRRAPPGPGRAGLAALRPRQDAGVPAGFVALADGRASRIRRTRTTGGSCSGGSSTAPPIRLTSTPPANGSSEIAYNVGYRVACGSSIEQIGRAVSGATCSFWQMSPNGRFPRISVV